MAVRDYDSFLLFSGINMACNGTVGFIENSNILVASFRNANLFFE